MDWEPRYEVQRSAQLAHQRRLDDASDFPDVDLRYEDICDQMGD